VRRLGSEWVRPLVSEQTRWSAELAPALVCSWILSVAEIDGRHVAHELQRIAGQASGPSAQWLRVNACRKLGRRGNPQASVAAREPSDAKAPERARGTHRWKTSRALEACSVRSAAQERGSRCSQSDLVLSKSAAGATGDCQREGHLSSRTATTPARARVRESRTTPTGQVTTSVAGGGAPNPAATRGRRRPLRGKPALSRTATSRPSHVGAGTVGRCGARRSERRKPESSRIEGSSGCS